MSNKLNVVIEPWMVMEAYSNGAEIEMLTKPRSSDAAVVSHDWQEVKNPIFDFSRFNYRIANKSADGLRFNKFMYEVNDKAYNINVDHNKPHMSKLDLLKYFIRNPKEIVKSSIRQEYRPFTWEERDQLRGKWIVEKDGKFEIILNLMYLGGEAKKTPRAYILEPLKGEYYVDFDYLFKNFTFLDGSVLGTDQ